MEETIINVHPIIPMLIVAGIALPVFLYFRRERKKQRTYIERSDKGQDRENNIIYSVDGDAEAHIERRLDEIFWKHHG